MKLKGICLTFAIDFAQLAINKNGPGIAALSPRKDFDERRLSGAILADQPMHLTWFDSQACIIERLDARETLTEPLNLNDVVRHFSIPSPNWCPDVYPTLV